MIPSHPPDNHSRYICSLFIFLTSGESFSGTFPRSEASGTCRPAFGLPHHSMLRIAERGALASRGLRIPKRRSILCCATASVWMAATFGVDCVSNKNSTWVKVKKQNDFVFIPSLVVVLFGLLFAISRENICEFALPCYNI
jgi:hypothetical protein